VVWYGKSTRQQNSRLITVIPINLEALNLYNIGGAHLFAVRLSSIAWPPNGPWGAPHNFLQRHQPDAIVHEELWPCMGDRTDFCTVFMEMEAGDETLSCCHFDSVLQARDFLVTS